MCAQRKAAILRLMRADPIEEWRRLREHYASMSDEELQELALDFVDLTEGAQQALRDEMKSRLLPDPKAPGDASKTSIAPIAPQWDTGADQSESTDAENASEEDEDGDLPREYTWKTLLCECNESAEAWQIYEVLRRAGIQSWLERPRSGWSVSGPRVVVAADQLDQAREIAARPIPQEVIDDSKADPGEFVLPVCPKCGAGDPLLEGVEPFNSWLCEACGKRWSDSPEALADTAEKPEK
jgi:hypothetical protein